jgi:hypothetical protein
MNKRPARTTAAVWALFLVVLLQHSLAATAAQVNFVDANWDDGVKPYISHLSNVRPDPVASVE